MVNIEDELAVIRVMLVQITNEIKELKNTRHPENRPAWETNPNKPATQKQIDAVAISGGEIWEGMTNKDISDQFKKINQKKYSKVQEPKEVDTQKAGLDEEGLL